MESSWKKRAGTFLKAQKRRKIWYRIVSVMAMAVVFVTTYLLILPAITMESKTVCGQAEHQHSGSCYSVQYPDPVRTLTCNTEALGIHRHTPACYDAAGSLICGYADFVIHTHDAACYDENGTLVCTLPETSLHVHTDACYQTERRLICTQEESAGHIHDTSCYTRQQGACTCALLEHTHDEACYGEEGNLICGQEEHVHTDSCYEWNEVLTCTVPESTGHTHTDACYETIAALVCTQPAELHTHTDACWQDGVLICGKIEVKEHQHTEVCFTETAQEPVNLLVCDIPEHIHTEECYEKTEAPLTEGTGTAAETEGTAAETQGGTVSETETGTLETPAGTTEAAETEEASDGSTILTVTAISAAGTVYDFERDCFISELKIEFAMERDQIQSGRIYCYTCPEGIRIAEALAGQEEMLSDESGTAIGSCSFVRNENGTDSIQVVFDNGYVLNAGEAVSGSVAFAGEISVDLADADGQIAVESSGLTLLIPAEEISWGMDQAVVLDEEDADSADGNDSTAAETGNVLPVTSISGKNVIYDKNADTYKTNVNLTFEFTADTNITAGTVYTYTYPDGVIIPPGELDKTQTLLDSSKRKAGTYKFIKNVDGSYSVQVVFDNDYVEKYCNQEEAVTGYVNFDGEFSKSSVKEDGSIVIGDGNLQINVPSKDITYPNEETNEYNISAAKQGEWKRADNQLIYTVYIRTTKGTPETISFTDTITIPEGLGLGTPNVTVEKGITNYYNGWYYDNPNLTTVTDVNPNYDSVTGKLTLTLGGLSKIVPDEGGYYQADFYKVTYTYLITDSNWSGEIKPNNTVVVSATDTTKDQTVKSEASTELYLSKDTSHTLEKYGEEDGSRIKWTVTVNKNQVNIAGAKLVDEMFKAAEDLQVVPSVGYAFNRDDGTIVFNEISGSENKNQYTIIYYTPAEDGLNSLVVTNNASFDPTPDNIENGDEKNAEYTVNVSGVNLDKWGQYDQNTGKINWTIDINSNNKNIAGVILTDSIFSGLQESNIVINPASNYELVREGGCITGIRFSQVDDTGVNEQHYTITYTVIPETLNPAEETKISNTANLKIDGGSEGPGKTGEVTVPPVTVTKSGYYADSKINWTVTVNANHRDIVGYELTDTMFSGLKETDIRITYNNWGGDVPANEYSIYTDGEGYVTKIVFNALSDTGVNTNQYYLIYTTTAEPEWNDKREKNDVHLKKGEIDISASSEVTIPGIKKVDKKAGSLSPSADGKTATITWNVTIDVPASGLPENVVITDDVTKDNNGNVNHLQWMTWEQIKNNEFTIYWKDAKGNIIGQSELYDEQEDSVFSLEFLASDGSLYDYKTITTSEGDSFQNMTYTCLTMSFTNGLIMPTVTEDALPAQITFSYDTTVDLEHSDIGTNRFYNAVDVDGEKADDYIDYEKAGVVKTDGNGNGDRSYTMSDGELVWKVKVKTIGSALTSLTVTDTLPAGVLPKIILVQGSGMSTACLAVAADYSITGDGSPYHYEGRYDPDSNTVVLNVTSTTASGTLLENQEWNFTFTCEADDTVLPPGGTYTLKNSVDVTTDQGSVGFDNQTQEWTHTQSTEETKVVQKAGEWDNNNRLLNYSIVLNPEGKDLVEGVDTLTLIDTLKYQSANIGGIWYEGTDGATFTVKADLVQNSVRLFKAVWENGQWIKGEEIHDFNWVYKIEKTNDWGETVTSTLTASGIPDEIPLIFQYAYSVSSSAENHPNEEKIKFNLPFRNEARLEGTDHSDSSSSAAEEWSHSSSSAGVTTGHHTYTFYKVVKDNYNKALPGAVFTVYEYDKASGSWSEIHTYTTDSEGRFVITFEDTNTEGKQIYKYNTVYGISETAAPEGYIKPEGYNPRYFYFSNAEDKNNLPDTIQSGAIDLSSESATAYVENIPNETEITVEKIWKDKNGDIIDHNSGSITVELYQKADQSGDSGAETVKKMVTGWISASDNPEWKEFSEEISVGSIITFSITNIYGDNLEEKKVVLTWNGEVLDQPEPTDGESWTATWGAKYTPKIYTYTLTVTENDVNQLTGSVSTQASDWEMSELSIQEPHSSITFTTTETTPYRTIILDANNNWTYTFTDLPLTGTDEEGNAVTYYYYIEEVLITNYKTSYENNGGIQTGTITVINKATETPEYELPETGGSGTALYTLGGLLLTAAAILLLYKKQTEKGGRHT